MTIDKSWTKVKNRFSNEFTTGLDAFIERCTNHLSKDGQCRCPCEKCDNHRWGTLDAVYIHIQRHEFSRNYTTWWYHGQQLHPLVVYETNDTEYEMIDFLNDVFNNVHQENTSNEPNTNSVEIGNEPNEGPCVTGNDDMDNLFELFETELYPGCIWTSVLNFLSKLSHMKVLNKWTDSSFDQLLALLKFAFPKGNTIPLSHYEAKKMMKKIRLGYESIHACKNDCCLFWKESENFQSCPICGESRWKDNNTSGKKVANKVLRYFPLTPRLKCMYSSRHIAKNMAWHATGQCTEDGKMRHPVDGTSWKDFDKKFLDFARETRNVRLGLAADGFNPYGNMSLSYSML